MRLALMIILTLLMGTVIGLLLVVLITQNDGSNDFNGPHYEPIQQNQQPYPYHPLPPIYHAPQPAPEPAPEEDPVHVPVFSDR